VDSALWGAVGLAIVVLPLSYVLGTPEKNINWVYGPARLQTTFHPLAYLGLLAMGFVVVVFLPTHLLIRMLFG
jgi:hypothetical protein